MLKELCLTGADSNWLNDIVTLQIFNRTQYADRDTENSMLDNLQEVQKPKKKTGTLRMNTDETTKGNWITLR